MGNKIITEKDFFICTGGMMPSPFQSRQKVAKRKDGAKYITKNNTSTVSWVDFGCKKMMLLYAVIAAIAAVAIALIVGTGGAALIAIGAAAGAIGSVLGAIDGTLICGQKAAPARKWLGSKSNFQILGIDTITGDHTITCTAFSFIGMGPETIQFAPEIKSWGQAIAKGAANFISNVMEGMMAGALIGTGGAMLSGGAAAFGAGGLRGLGQAGLNLLKNAPLNVAKNFGQGLFNSAGFKALDGLTNVLNTYGDTGKASAADFTDGVKNSTFGDAQAVKNILTGHGSMQDYVAAGMLLIPGGHGGHEHPNSPHIVEPHGNPHVSEPHGNGTHKEGDHSQNEGDESDGTQDKEGNAPKSHATEPHAAKDSKGDAYADGGDAKIKPKPRTLEPIKLDEPIIPGKKVKGKEGEFNRQLKAQEKGINSMTTKEWLENREKFKREKATKEYKRDAKKARDDYRKQEIDKRTKENIRKGIKPKEKAKVEAIESMKGQAALHNPDAVVGGNPNKVTDMGDRGVNSSIGSQWGNGKADALESRVVEQLNKEGYKVPPIENVPDDIIMNVDLF